MTPIMKRKRTIDPEQRYITRYHDKRSGNKGWWVRLQDYHSMTMLGQKAFYDHHYPQPYGKYAALVDAMLYRDKLAEKVGGYFIDKIEKEICPYYNTIKRRDNKFGHVWCCILNCEYCHLITIQDATPFPGPV